MGLDSFKIQEPIQESSDVQESIRECRRCSGAITDTFLTLFRSLTQIMDSKLNIRNITDSLCGICTDDLQSFLNGAEIEVSADVFKNQVKEAYKKGFNDAAMAVK